MRHHRVSSCRRRAHRVPRRLAGYPAIGWVWPGVVRAAPETSICKRIRDPGHWDHASPEIRRERQPTLVRTARTQDPAFRPGIVGLALPSLMA